MNDASSRLSAVNGQPNDEYLKLMEGKARNRYIPIIKPETGQFLRVMIKASKPARILEIGTAIGYSTILMARAAGEGVEVVTIEINEDLALEARENFLHYGLENRINLKIGDALEILPYLKREYELVFIDAAKGQYLNYLDLVIDLVPPGGVIIADNVLYRGYVRKKGSVKHKRRTMVNVLREYIKVVKNHPLLDSSIVPIGDGLAVSVRR
jgi:predicted O-methyltransferase YrrM